MNPYIFGGELLAFLLALWLILIFTARRIARLVRSPIVKKLEEMTATFGLVPTASHIGRLDYEERSFWVQHLRLQADMLEADMAVDEDDDEQPDPLPFDPNKPIRL